MWLESQVALKELLAQELPAQPPKPERDRALFFHTLATLFLRYVQIARRLEACYDQMVQPQKRRGLRYMLDSVLGRVLELKQEMVALELCEYHYMDDVLQDLKLTPVGLLEVPIPKYFLRERAKALQERQAVLSDILTRMDPHRHLKPLRSIMLREEAVRMVQMAERMRQGRLRAKFMWEIHRDEERARKARESGAKELNQDQAAVCIQKVWKGCLQRRRTKLERQEEMTFIGMSLNPSSAMLRVQMGEEFRRVRQADYEAEYQEALASIRDHLYAVEGPNMREVMKEQLRQWFIECLRAAYPPYPASPLPGFLACFLTASASRVGAVAQAWLVGAGRAVLGLSPHCFGLPSGCLGSPQVDELMREELQSLRLAVDREEAKAQKPKKSAKVRESLPLGPARLRVLLAPLFPWGKVGVPCPQQRSTLFSPAGDFCYLGTALRLSKIEPTPSVLDVRQNITLYAILRLGSPTLHELAPLVKSVLLVGPAGTGKKMLVHAVCTETGANLFDLSPDNVVGKYPGKSGLQMMMHMVLKVPVARIGLASNPAVTPCPHFTRADRLLGAPLTLEKPILYQTGLCPTEAPLLFTVTWQCLIRKHGGTFTSALDLSALAKVSDGYSQGHVVQAVQTVLTEQRLLQMSKKPLVAREFLQLLAKVDPIYQEEEEMLKDWYRKTPLGRKRLKAAQDKAELAEGKGKGKDKKGKK
uniref:IQ motif containing with AAA domain 1 like n=1 Tax=Sphenodon punctatus TaxID=8508 RepID=A0A8D0HBU7_SPHPU